ncbi:hypothetical protein ACIQGZ_05575 [Streptomyces sp. NPDC092296]|uniref:hypothetical protein n=1 Tax=Streptomyces sp. NPDC092296 TaxID=3366012 RepID=UPI0037F5FCE8
MNAGSGVPVPYIATWSSEKRHHESLVVHPVTGRLAYRDERPGDRDEHGVLWVRADCRPKRGRPQFGLVHPRRQRHAMRDLRCQVCDGPADVDGLGSLWLLRDERGVRADWPAWPEGMAATDPPLCLPCARVSVRLCPHLRGRYVAVRVRDAQVAGVYGGLYFPKSGGGRPRVAADVTVPYDDPNIHRILAAQQVMELRGCTFIDLPD